MARRKFRFSPEAAIAAGEWLEDALANSFCSIEHEAKTDGFVVTDNGVLLLFEYRNANIDVKAIAQFKSLDAFAMELGVEVLKGLAAADNGAEALLDQMIATAESEDVKECLREAKGNGE